MPDGQRHGQLMRNSSRIPTTCFCAGVVQHRSIERGHFSIALLLLENRKGRCALSFAAAPSKDDQHQIRRVSQLDIINLLASHGAQIDGQDVRDKTPRDHAQGASESPETSNPSFNRAAAVYLLKKLEMA